VGEHPADDFSDDEGGVQCDPDRKRATKIGRRMDMRVRQESVCVLMFAVVPMPVTMIVLVSVLVVMSTVMAMSMLVIVIMLMVVPMIVFVMRMVVPVLVVVVGAHPPDNLAPAAVHASTALYPSGLRRLAVGQRPCSRPDGVRKRTAYVSH
jgi:hypothetical protein